MLLIKCPYCNEVRHEEEYAYLDEAFIFRPENMDAITDQELSDYLYNRSNPRGIIFEQWQHTVGCRKIFIVKRDTTNNKIYESYKLNEKIKSAINIPQKQECYL